MIHELAANFMSPASLRRAMGVVASVGTPRVLRSIELSMVLGTTCTRLVKSPYAAYHSRYLVRLNTRGQFNLELTAAVNPNRSLEFKLGHYIKCLRVDLFASEKAQSSRCRLLMRTDLLRCYERSVIEQHNA